MAEGDQQFTGASGMNDEIWVRILKRMRSSGKLSAEEYDEALRTGQYNGTDLRQYYTPRSGESYDQWVERVGTNPFLGITAGQSGFGSTMTDDDVRGMFSAEDFAQATMTPEQKAEQEKLKGETARAEQWRQRVDEFYKQMTIPLDQDPTWQKMKQEVRGSAEMDVYQRTGGGSGGGGVADASVDRAVADAAIGYDQHRLDRASQAMSLGLGDAAGLEKFREDQYRYDAGQKYQADQQKWAADRESGQMWGGLAGGVGGGILGGLTGNPAAAAKGAEIGSQVGAGLGGNFAGGPPSAPTRGSNY